MEISTHITLVIILVWIVCGILAYGITYGYFHREYPLINHEKDIKRTTFFISIVQAMAGPIGLVVSIFSSKFIKHGMKFK